MASLVSSSSGTLKATWNSSNDASPKRSVSISTPKSQLLHHNLAGLSLRFRPPVPALRGETDAPLGHKVLISPWLWQPGDAQVRRGEERLLQRLRVPRDELMGYNPYNR
jgi:hypothetical protein